MSRFRLVCRQALAALVIGGSLSSAVPTAEASGRYFKNVRGTWVGSGEIVAGTYRGTRFSCKLKGTSPAKAKMRIAGSCRIGLFRQKVSATLRRRGRGYKGTFLDGAKGNGMDITSGRLDRNRLTVAINRKDLNGAMVANLVDRGTLRISISVWAGEDYVPVIGLELKRAKG